MITGASSGIGYATALAFAKIGSKIAADTQCGPQQREKLERLCRYITRPALSHKRLCCSQSTWPPVYSAAAP